MNALTASAYMGCWDGQPVYVDLLQPDLSNVPWATLCRAVCGINRFNGVTTPLISVGGHSIRVMRRLREEMRVYGLLHDLHEGIMGDQTRPFRQAVGHVGPIGTLPIDTIEQRLQAAIHAKADVPWPLPPLQQAMLEEADDWACQEELQHDKAGTLAERFGDETLTPHPKAFTRYVVAAIAEFHVNRSRAAQQRAEAMDAALAATTTPTS
ncbi:MAG: hypothetical protein AAGI03_01450 [Pseudomonadota bacterium]